MNVYIVLLRGVNVGGHRKIKMTDLKAVLGTLGFIDIVTYIQSGNIIFKDPSDDIDALQIKIKAAIKKYFGFDVPVLIIASQKLKEILQKNPYGKRLETGDIQGNKMYFIVFFNRPDPIAVKELSKLSFDPEEFVITQNSIYLFAANTYGKTKLNNGFFEKKLKCQATARNLRTMNKLLELSI